MPRARSKDAGAQLVGVPGILGLACRGSLSDDSRTNRTMGPAPLVRRCRRSPGIFQSSSSIRSTRRRSRSALPAPHQRQFENAADEVVLAIQDTEVLRQAMRRISDSGVGEVTFRALPEVRFCTSKIEQATMCFAAGCAFPSSTPELIPTRINKLVHYTSSLEERSAFTFHGSSASKSSTVLQ
jgi:hypothetical protein